VIERGFMPPWRAAAGVARYANDRSLAPEERALLLAWLREGAPRGRGVAPPPPTWPEGWQLGAPDLVVTLPSPYTLPAQGTDVYRNFVIPAPVSDERYVAAWELRAGTRTIHHAIVNVDHSGWARSKEAEDPEPGFAGMDTGSVESPGGFSMVWTPGKTPARPIAGTAFRLDRATDLVLQLHMQPTGKPETVAPTLGFFFAEGPPTRLRVSVRIGDPRIDIPAGEARYTIADAYTLPADAELVSLFPHAHLLAKEMEVWVSLPDGRRQGLLRIPDWDPAWQDEYVFAQPLTLPAGTTVSMRFLYDNSAANVRNPNRPPRRVVSGETNRDEMGNVTLYFLPGSAASAERFRESKYRRQLDGGEGVRAHYNLGNVRLREGRVDEAIAEYRQAIAIDPTLAPAYYNLGNALARKGDPEGAIAAFSRAVAIQPRLVGAHVNWGAALAALGRRAAAIEQYRAALEIDPSNAAARGALEALGAPDAER
jgi:hypothetical protein